MSYDLDLGPVPPRVEEFEAPKSPIKRRRSPRRRPWSPTVRFFFRWLAKWLNG